MSAFEKQEWGNINGEVSYDRMLDESSTYAFNCSGEMNIDLRKRLLVQTKWKL
ncbi:hypothetical protein [Ancylomarina sp. 16SWW S1-10-2]|uniref:hypothetical protein n=1 Tax=Ancylomarina sp. 16SWW S1-10-2 TaxID=2499681 RepID=UPI0012AE3E42|nr:hypothetical protein [Ancylomarina sp. 16SWW S1-10-2]